MDVISHLEQKIKKCSSLDEVPVLRDAVVAYLTRQGSLAQVQQSWNTWQAELGRHPYDFDYFLLHLWKRPRTHLDTFDYHILDLYFTTSRVSELLIAIAHDEPSREQVDEIYAYLANQGIAYDSILRELVELQFFWVFADRGLNAQDFSVLTQRLLSFLPSDPQQFVQFLGLGTDPFWDEDVPEAIFDEDRLSNLVDLLRVLPSPPLDLIWAIVQIMEARRDDSLGLYAAELLKLNPARFTAWARQLAGPASPATSSSRHTVLKALLKLDPVQHLDLAAAAASEPLSNDNWHHFVQIAGLKTAYRLDPVRYQPLVEKMAHQEHHWLGLWASRLLAGVPVEDIRSFWWHCVIEESVPVALTAFESLQANNHDPFRGIRSLRENAQRLLGHPSQEMRDAAISWLVQHQDAYQPEWVRPALRDAATSWQAQHQDDSQSEWPEWVRSALHEETDQ